MPIDYKKYPANWKSEIRPAIMSRAGSRCEICGVAHYSVVKWDKTIRQWERACGNIYIDEIGANGAKTYQEARQLAAEWNSSFNDEDDRGWIVIVLTIAHLNHDVTDNRPENLKALCQRCHNNHDKDYRKQNAKTTIATKRGLIDLFGSHSPP